MDLKQEQNAIFEAIKNIAPVSELSHKTEASFDISSYEEALRPLVLEKVTKPLFRTSLMT